MWFILNPKKEVYVGSDIWNPELARAKLFDTKDETLDYVRTRIQADQDADPPRYPTFTGCRVVNLITHIVLGLRKRGLKVEGDQTKQVIYLDVKASELESLRKTLPRAAGGIPFKLRVGGKVKPWDWPPKG